MSEKLYVFIFVAVFLITFILGVVQYSKSNKTTGEMTFFVIGYGILLLLFELIVTSLVVEFLGI